MLFNEDTSPDGPQILMEGCEELVKMATMDSKGLVVLLMMVEELFFLLVMRRSGAYNRREEPVTLNVPDEINMALKGSNRVAVSRIRMVAPEVVQPQASLKVAHEGRNAVERINWWRA
ncbi:LOW QUALITY PROTEIN: hypothetical protein PanWU01x14_117290 [Parasponia andersonii]|uniref:Uncharacterized protein n=1 Tax=Parasponia andersonii TaxID=3476 RepID=A0A2P5CWQ2_PARAD|nr:LOW QUALITY PROTEIN: hypothetical protein PanWU01x14_117290 [Parasponia andersonii]